MMDYNQFGCLEELVTTSAFKIPPYLCVYKDSRNPEVAAFIEEYNNSELMKKYRMLVAKHKIEQTRIALASEFQKTKYFEDDVAKNTESDPKFQELLQTYLSK